LSQELQTWRTLNYSGSILLSVYCGFAGWALMDRGNLRSEWQVEARINCQTMGWDMRRNKMRWGASTVAIDKGQQCLPGSRKIPAGILILFCVPNCC